MARRFPSRTKIFRHLPPARRAKIWW